LEKVKIYLPLKKDKTFTNKSNFCYLNKENKNDDMAYIIHSSKVSGHDFIVDKEKNTYMTTHLNSDCL